MKNKNLGSICFDKTLNRWLVFYYITDNMSDNKKRAKKSFKNELDAQKFLEQYNSNNQDDNSFFSKNCCFSERQKTGSNFQTQYFQHL